MGKKGEVEKLVGESGMSSGDLLNSFNRGKRTPPAPPPKPVHAEASTTSRTVPADKEKGSKDSKDVCGFCLKPGKLTRVTVCNIEEQFHKHCILWCPDVTPDPDNPAEYRSLDVAYKRAKKVKCGECKQLGASNACQNKECRMAYHPKCATLAGCEVVTNKEGKQNLYCINHLDDNVFFVEKVKAKRFNKTLGKTEYYIKWEGYPESSNTWEGADNIHPGLIQDFERESAAAAAKAKQAKIKAEPNIKTEGGIPDKRAKTASGTPKSTDSESREDRMKNRVKTEVKEEGAGKDDTPRRGPGRPKVQGTPITPGVKAEKDSSSSSRKRRAEAPEEADADSERSGGTKRKAGPDVDGKPRFWTGHLGKGGYLQTKAQGRLLSVGTSTAEAEADSAILEQIPEFLDASHRVRYDLLAGEIAGRAFTVEFMSNNAAFAEFCKYWQDRDRAGVVISKLYKVFLLPSKEAADALQMTIRPNALVGVFVPLPAGTALAAQS